MVPAHAQQRPTASPEDVASIDGIINAYYEAVSGPPGKRDSAIILSIYAPGAKYNIRLRDGVPFYGIVEEVVKMDMFLNITSNFYEREIFRDEQRFGNLANVISTYGISDSLDNNNFTARGGHNFSIILCRRSLVDHVVHFST